METKISKTVLAQLIPSGFESLQNEELIEETATPGSILTAGKEKYTDNSCTLSKQVGLNTEVQPNETGQIVFNDNGDAILKPSLIITGGISGLNSGPYIPQRTEIVYYTVQNGDTVSTIARRFNLTVNTILWANNLSALSLIRPGDTLTILPYSGVLYTVKSGDTVAKIANRYSVSADKILSCNNLGSGLKAGQKLIIPGAVRIAETVAAKPASTYTGVSVIRDLVKTPVAKITGSLMAWPTVGHTITQYFSWHHPGVDIANKTGTPVYAADSGTVIFAGWATGYGNSIVIDHGGGKKTRYGHSSKLLVSVGDEVEKGDKIMLMGSTGWSTGPHLHFEVIINGTKYNPLNYIR